MPPARTHRPCPKCGNRLRNPHGRQPANCGVCGAKLRAKTHWTILCACGWQVMDTNTIAARDAFDAHLNDCPKWRETLAASPRWTVFCDCGWTYSNAVLTDCKQHAAWHRQQVHA